MGARLKTLHLYYKEEDKQRLKLLSASRGDRSLGDTVRGLVEEDIERKTK